MLASIEKMVKPISLARNSTSRCFIWNISRVPWVLSPKETMRASPINALSGIRSSNPLPASTVLRTIAFSLIQAVCSGVGSSASAGGVVANATSVRAKVLLVMTCS